MTDAEIREMAAYFGEKLDEAKRGFGARSPEAMQVRRMMLYLIRTVQFNVDQRQIFQRAYMEKMRTLRAAQETAPDDDIWDEGLGDA